VSIEADVESAQLLMKQPAGRLVVVTGVPVVVKQAMKLWAEGHRRRAGNPPAVVDATANLDKAAYSIGRGASSRHQHRLHPEKRSSRSDSNRDELIRRSRALPVLRTLRPQVRALEA